MQKITITTESKIAVIFLQRIFTIYTMYAMKIQMADRDQERKMAIHVHKKAPTLIHLAFSSKKKGKNNSR